MKRFFLVIGLAVLIAIPACKSGKKQIMKPTIVQTKPKKSEVKLPEVKLPEVVPSVKKVNPKVRRPSTMVIKPKPTVVVPKVKPTVVVPKVEPTVVMPKVEPKLLQPKPIKQIYIVDRWIVPQPSSMTRELFAITFVVRNLTSKDVKVKVICYYMDGSLFSESIPNTVDAHSDGKLMVMGFRGCPREIECHKSLDCQVKVVK